jgi:hypothetical protein
MPNPTRVTTVPESERGALEEHVRLIAQGVNGLQNGQGNNGFFATLTPNETETTIYAGSASIGSVPLLQPMSASAAVSYAAGVIWTEGRRGRIVIHHDSSAVADRLFGVVLNG